MKRLSLLVLLTVTGVLLVVSGFAATGPIDRKIGLVKHDPAKAYQGYTLFAPKHNTTIHLLDMNGGEVNSWKSRYEPGQSVYLTEEGTLLHTCFMKGETNIAGGEGGRIEEFDWDGDMIWQLDFRSKTWAQHHDIAPMPNGNIVLLCVETKTKAECVQAGFSPEAVEKARGLVYAEWACEVEKIGSNKAEIIWEWHIWDHLIQDKYPDKDNYGVVGDHPELLDPNAYRVISTFWNHANGIDYTPELDQVAISARGQNEIWVIDASTTTEEAKSHKGGKCDKGGDLIYRWGNPVIYDRGHIFNDKQLYQQHDVQWIPKGYPGEGNITIFNNGGGRGWSTVDEIVPPVDKNGCYVLEEGKAFGPEKPVWTYQAENKRDFYSEQISGGHKLLNGNTFITSGTHGVLFEVTPEGETVWEYVNPIDGTGPLSQDQLIPIDHRGHAMISVFKAHRYPLDYPTFKGKDMSVKKKSLVKGEY